MIGILAYDYLYISQNGLVKCCCYEFYSSDSELDDNKVIESEVSNEVCIVSLLDRLKALTKSDLCFFMKHRCPFIDQPIMASLPLMIKLQDNAMINMSEERSTKSTKSNRSWSETNSGKSLRRDDGITKRIKFLDELNTEGAAHVLVISDCYKHYTIEESCAITSE